MLPCQPPRKPQLPRLWLMTDARLGSDMARAIARMPPRSGVILRPYALGTSGTAARMRHFRRVARAKRHLLLIGQRNSAGYDGMHIGGPNRRSAPLARWRSMAVHNGREAARATRLGVDAMFVSPVWPTASHLGSTGIGLRGLRRTAAKARCAVIALGGVSQSNAHLTRRHGAHGWAAISAWLTRPTR